METPTLTPGEKLVVGGGVVVLAAGVLPWISTSGASWPGYAVDGGFGSLMLAVSVLGIVALWDWLLYQQLVVGLSGVLIAILAGGHVLAIGTPGAGIGAYVSLVAGIVIAGSAGHGVLERRRSQSETVEERAQLE